MGKILVDEYYIERLEDKIKRLQRTVSSLQNENKELERDKDHAEYRIRTELEPRIKQEQRSYDFWVSQATGERESEHFTNTIDELCEFIKGENSAMFEWGEPDGDLYQMILFLMQNETDIDIFEIEEKEKD